ncbi:DNA invertase Pin-like site-specific DNA recombinase [Edaphobacter lichenicola]|uniref:DNA invertase Pin-like site-specific DNA recombinase n=1 Tax=Tunturiibacter lichenicola TaxID=2051959 RepID=A0A7Y9NQZ0_9BACT|nr:DNA invertase Pin-like site-specific DNA recombinase [Edaphobacter lichenicola]
MKTLEKEPKPFDYVLIDDTSRCSRKPQDIMDFIDIARHCKIGVRFVAQNLDTVNPQFDMMLQLHAMIDKQYVDRLSVKCFEGQMGRVLNGYHCGSEAYGYRSVRIADPASLKGGRQSGTLGSKLVIDEEEAEVVRRIFRLFADGESMLGIAKALNRDRIPSPQNSRARKEGSQWCTSAIKDILHNEKYKGLYVWNASYQSEHPKTGELIKVKKAEHEVIRLERPEIRIVPDILWNAAAARLARMQDRQVQRVQGGYNRATNRPYLYSGFLYCGECGQKLIANGLQGKARYKCENARLHRGCYNRMSIPEQVVAEQLTGILSTQLLVPEIFDELVRDVIIEVEATVLREKSEARRSELPELEKHLQACNSALTNLTNSIELSPSPSLFERLRERDRERVLLMEKIRIARDRQRVTITRELLQDLVQENLSELRNVLESNVPLARELLSGHLLKLYLQPNPDSGDNSIHVVGGFDLFSGSNAANKRVLLEGSSTRTLQQHPGFLNFVALFDGSHKEPCLFFEPLIELLGAEPDLSDDAKSPEEWAWLLREHLGERWDDSKKLGYGATTRCFRVHADLLATRILVEKVPDPATQGRGHLYRLQLKDDVLEKLTPAA